MGVSIGVPGHACGVQASALCDVGDAHRSGTHTIFSCSLASIPIRHRRGRFVHVDAAPTIDFHVDPPAKRFILDGFLKAPRSRLAGRDSERKAN